MLDSIYYIGCVMLGAMYIEEGKCAFKLKVQGMSGLVRGEKSGT